MVSAAERRVRCAFGLLLLAAVGCGSGARHGPDRSRTPLSGPSATASPSPGLAALARGSRAVTFRASDGTRLSGQLFGAGPIAVIAAHMGPADQTSWWPLANTLADRGYEVLTFDERGYCPHGLAGCSAGDPRDITDIWSDVEGGVAWLGAHGAKTIVAVGASQGASASFVAASHPRSRIDAVVWLSGTDALFISESERISAAVRVPKLFVTGRDDLRVLGPTRYVFAHTPEPKELHVLPTAAHGTDMLVEAVAGAAVAREAGDLVIGFLARYAPAG